MEDDSPADDSDAATSKVETGFRETINPDDNENLGDQLEDPNLSEEAKADYSQDMTEK